MPGTGKKMLMWLGLADAEEYDDYEPYEEMPAPQVASVRRGGEPLEAVSSGSPGSSGSPAVQDPAARRAGPRRPDQPAGGPDQSPFTTDSGTRGPGPRGLAD